MSSRKLEHLHPAFQVNAKLWQNNCKARGVDTLIYCTYRSPQEQADLYAIGRTVAGKRLTWARPGKSLHNYQLDGKPAALAFDAVPMLHGRIIWEITPETRKLWQIMGDEAKKLGIEWGGNWKGEKIDRPHFQMTI